MPTDTAVRLPPARRVLLITARADHGGGPRHILDLLRAFHNERRVRSVKFSDVEFYIAAPEQEPYAKLFRELVRNFIEIPARSFSLATFFQLLFFIRRERINIIHSHGRGAGVYSRLLGVFSGARVLHTFHGIHREPSVKGRMKLLVDQLLAFFPFTAIFVSENEQQEGAMFRCVRGTSGRVQNQIVIENAVDTSRFNSRAAPPMSIRNIRLGAFVRDDMVKGPDLFLKLAREFTNVGHWTCAGISRSELATFGKFPETLEIMDRLHEPAAWLQSLDVFVSTARNEGLPLGVLEAMAAGCLCVLSDIPAHKSFADENAALLFDPQDSRSFQSALSRLEHEPQLRAELLKNALQLIESRHSLESFKARLESVYHLSKPL